MLSSIFSWIAGLHHGRRHPADASTGCATDVDAKLGRLPLRYFDSHPRGDLLSRVTNDIDNIGQSLQQSLTQLITSLLTIVGVLIMMLLISPILAVVSLLAVPALAGRRRPHRPALAAAVRRPVGVDRRAQRPRRGDAHRPLDREGVRPPARGDRDASTTRTSGSTTPARKAQFISGIIQPAMNFISNLNYVAIAVIGGLRVASGQMTLGDVVAFIQYSRQFTFPIIQTASIVNVLQSAVASAERVFELLDEPEEIADPVAPPALRASRVGAVAFEDVSFRYEPDQPLIDDLTSTSTPAQTVAIVGPTGAGKTTLVNLLMRFYELDGGRITVDGIDTRDLTRDDLRRGVRDGPPGHVAVPRHDPREHRLRPRSDATEEEIRRGGRGGPRRPLRADAARRLRHGHRRRRDEPLGRARSSS